MVEAAVWSLVALQAATLLGVFRMMNGRMDKLADRMDMLVDRIDVLGVELRTELRRDLAEFRQEMRAEMAELRREMRAVGQRIDAHVEWHAG